MANSIIPQPVLDLQNGDQVVADIIDSLPPELSDRSDSNPAVVIAEAVGLVYDKFIFQINQLPSAVVQNLLNIIGSPIKDASAAIVSQQFTLTSPQPTDTTIPSGTDVSTSDGKITFSTQADLTIPAFTSYYSDDAYFTAGSKTVTCGSNVSFTTGSSWVGYQIRLQGTNTWYTIASVDSATSLTLSAVASSTADGYFDVGPVSGTVQAQATASGNAANVGAATLTNTSAANVLSTTNPSVAANGTDAETPAQAIARSQLDFCRRDVACTATDYEQFATAILGDNSRAKASGAMNGTSAQSGYVSIGLLSPSWSTSSAITAQERINVRRDLANRTMLGSTTVDLPANIQSFTASGSMPVACIYRLTNTNATGVQVNMAENLNSYLTPNTYEWGRTIYAADLLRIIENTQGVDRVHSINGIPAIGMDWTTPGQTYNATNGSSTVSNVPTGDISAMTAGRSFWVDLTGNLPTIYLITALGSSTITLDRNYEGDTNNAIATSKMAFFTSADKALTNWYSLPYCNLSVDPSNPATSMVILGIAS